MKETYCAKRHPAVIEGRKTERQVYDEFLNNFEMHHNSWAGEKNDSKITKTEWIEYYTNISACIDNDAYFA